MDWEHAALGLLSVVMALIGALLRELWTAVKEQRRDLSDLEIKISDHYVKIPDFNTAVDRILVAIDKLRDDLHGGKK